MTTTRTWEMYATRRERDGVTSYEHFGDERWVRMCYRFVSEPVAVTLTEDPDGSHYGWIETGTDAPTMIQPHPIGLQMQFAYGYEVEEERGRGRRVRLSVTERAGKAEK